MSFNITIFKNKEPYILTISETISYAALCQRINEKVVNSNGDNHKLIYRHSNDLITLKDEEDLKLFIKEGTKEIFILTINLTESLESFGLKENKLSKMEEKLRQVTVIEPENYFKLKPRNATQESGKENQSIDQQEIDKEEILNQAIKDLQDENNEYQIKVKEKEQTIESLEKERINLINQLKAEKDKVFIQKNHLDQELKDKELIEKQLKKKEDFTAELKKLYDDSVKKCKEMEDKIKENKDIKHKNQQLINENKELLDVKEKLANQLETLKEEQAQTKKFNDLKSAPISFIEYKSINQRKDSISNKAQNIKSNIINDKIQIEIIQNELIKFKQDQKEFNLEVNRLSNKAHEYNKFMIMSNLNQSSFDSQMKCRHCFNIIIGRRYQCMTCPEYNICGACLSLSISNTHQKIENFHHHSTFIEIDISKDQKAEQEINQLSSIIKETTGVNPEMRTYTNQCSSFDLNYLNKGDDNNNNTFDLE